MSAKPREQPDVTPCRSTESLLTDEQVRLSWRPSVACGDDLTMVGGDGFSRTVTDTDCKNIISIVYQICMKMYQKSFKMY